ncbi:MAG: decaprenyl-phosphate phosphoribosyltransferase [Mycobacteriales bacterium]
MTDAAIAAPRIAAPPRSTIAGLLASTRPRQWLKGVLVLAAPVAAGRWLHPEVMIGVMIAFAAFTATAAGCYLLNDVIDAPADRLHPVKRHRAVAAGVVSVPLAITVGAVLVLAGPAIAFGTDREELGLVVVAYGALTLAYTGGLKAVPWLESVLLASGFVLRPLAGAAGSGVPPSGYFLAVCCAGALMVALGKRYAEIQLADAGSHRSVLARYSPAALRAARTAAGVALAAGYLAWAVSRTGIASVTALVSAAAVIVAVYRYLIRSNQGEGGEPERLLLSDRVLLTAALVWAGALLLTPFGI